MNDKMDESIFSNRLENKKTCFNFLAEFEKLNSGSKEALKLKNMEETSFNQAPKGKMKLQFDLVAEYKKAIDADKKRKDKSLKKKLTYSKSKIQRENKPTKDEHMGLKRNIALDIDSNPTKKKKMDNDYESKAKKKLFSGSSSAVKRKFVTPSYHKKRSSITKFIEPQLEIENICYDSDSSELDHSSMSEFLKLENECSANNMSPLSDLSNQLQHTNITKSVPKGIIDCINEISSKMEKDLKSFNCTYSKGMQEIRGKLLYLEESKSIFYSGFCQTLKELNCLKEKFDKKDNENIKSITPRLKSENLRVATLNKNLSKVVIDNKTPDHNMKEAMKLYNSFKGDLGSPIKERANLQTPKSSSKRYIAIKLQKQCLMLCDTPQKK